MNKICTSIDQSKKLIELGIDVNTADMCYLDGDENEIIVMKELSIVKKAKAYDEVVNKLRHFIAQGVDPLITRADVQDFFPELAESEDEKIKKALIKYFSEGREYLSLIPYNKEECITWLEKQGEKLEIQKETDLPKGEDYGIDALWHAQRILEKTLGEVNGYQSDDGILEHKCAISAIKELYKRKPYWSEEDEKTVNNIIDYIKPMPIFFDSTNGKSGKEYTKEFIKEAIRWLKSLKDRIGG